MTAVGHFHRHLHLLFASCSLARYWVPLSLAMEAQLLSPKFWPKPPIGSTSTLSLLNHFTHPLIIVVPSHARHRKTMEPSRKQPHPWTLPAPPAVSLYTERWSPCAQLPLATKRAAWSRIGTDSNLLDRKACWMGFSSVLPHCASSTDSRASGIGVMCGEAPLFWF